MPTYSGPKINNKDSLKFTYQPGHDTSFDSKINKVVASDVVHTNDGKLNGPQRISNHGFGDVRDDVNNISNGPTIDLSSIITGNTIYTLDKINTSIYTISLWVNIKNFPSNYTHKSIDREEAYSTKIKRTSIARFHYSTMTTDVNDKNDGFIEFGAMAPYYRDKDNVYVYKSIFEPFSIGIAIGTRKHCRSIYTDYNFNLNKWYLITLQIESDSNFNNTKQLITTKMYINDELQEVAESYGMAWREHKRDQTKLGNKRMFGLVATQPGFSYKHGNNTFIHSNLITMLFKQFLNLDKLNYINYSPIKVFGPNINDGINGYGSGNQLQDSKYQTNSSIDFGQLYIYDKGFDSTIYLNYKNMYN